MVERKADLDVQDKNLVKAVEDGSLEILADLLARGANPNAEGEEGGRILHLAVAYRRPDLVKLLLERGADPNAQSGYFNTTLGIAASAGSFEITKLLLERGADPNAQSKKFVSALQIAAIFGSFEITKLLLECGADPNVQDGYHGNALQAATAADTKSFEITKLLLERGAEPNAQGGYYGNALQAATAADTKSLEITKLLLECGADPDAQGGYYGNALQAAAYAKSFEKTKLLLECGADPNMQGGYYGNALQAAAQARSESFKIAKILLERGADPNAQGGCYGNALQAAASQWGSPETVKLLLDQNADATIQPLNETRESLLHVAVMSCNLETLRTLCRAGADIHLSSQNDSGLTPLHLAIREEHAGMVQHLLDRGASPDVEDFGDTSCFQLAMRKQDRDMVLLLYPKTTAGLSLISASDWRRLSDSVLDCHLEMISGEDAQVVFRDQSLEKELLKMWYPISSKSEIYAYGHSHFMNKHVNGKRMFILADGSMLYPEVPSDFHCRWWSRPTRQEHVRADWSVWIKSAPNPSSVRQILAKDCFLECALYLTCYVLPDNMEHRPSDVQLASDSLKDFESRQAIMWIMMKREASQVDPNSRNNVLESRIYFHTSEYAEIPKLATDLLPHLVRKLRSISDQNVERFQEHLRLMRRRILRSSGTDPNLIQCLLTDAQVLDVLKGNVGKQIETLQSFAIWYQNKSMETSHEEPLDQVREKMKGLKEDSDAFQETTEKHLRGLTEASKDLIQLEFNLTSITEAQRSTSTNKSMKRLSWITFIFLPLLFIASLFGMNVDILKNNPAWWWYLPIAVGTTLVTFLVWVIFKRNKSLEGSLEKRFQWLIAQPKRGQDLEMGSTSEEEAKRAETMSFSSRGKKRS